MKWDWGLGGGGGGVPGVGRGLDGEVILSGGAEGGAPEDVQAVDEDERARQVFPALGDGALHLVQAHVKLLDHVPVTVSDLGRPR